VRVNPDRFADPRAVRFEVEGAYAQALPGLHGWMLDWCFEPEEGEAGATVLTQALALTGDEALQVWVREPTSEHDRVAAELGLTETRDLWELRVPLPLDGEPPDLDWRPFRVGVDEAAWLEVNNRAFHWHPEQGGWTVEQIVAEEREPWFDPRGFVMHWRDGRLAGFCWTKVHADHDPPLGEIYVIAADPDFGGQGLGRALTETGLDWMHRERNIEVGMLYVDADNAPAVRLYDRLGFTRHHTDRAYTRAG
jgi:mycothiol synthase